MERVEKTKINIDKTREELFNYLSISDEFQDLTDNFSKLAENSPEVYEILLLIYQEFQTRDKINRKKISNMLNIQLNTKQYSIEIIKSIIYDLETIKEKLEKLNDEVYLFEKLKRGVNWKNIWKAIGTISFVFLILSSFQYFAPSVYDTIVELIKISIDKKG